MMKLQEIYEYSDLKEMSLRVLSDRINKTVGCYDIKNIALFYDEVNDFKVVPNTQFFKKFAIEEPLNKMKYKEEHKEATYYMIDFIQRIMTPVKDEEVKWCWAFKNKIEVVHHYYSELYKQERNLEAIFEDIKNDIMIETNLSEEITGKYVYMRIFRTKDDSIYFYVGQHQCDIDALNQYNLDPNYRGSGAIVKAIEQNCVEVCTFNLGNAKDEEELAVLEHRIIEFCANRSYIRPFLLNNNTTKQVFKKGRKLNIVAQDRSYTRTNKTRLNDSHLIKNRARRETIKRNFDYLLVTQNKTNKTKVFCAADYKTREALYDDIALYFGVKELQACNVCNVLSHRRESHRGLQFKIIGSDELAFC